MRQGKPVIAGTNSYPNHWVVISGYRGNTLLVNDPANGAAGVPIEQATRFSDRWTTRFLYASVGATRSGEPEPVPAPPPVPPSALSGNTLWWPSPSNFLERFCLEIMKHEGWKPESRSVRNNNPGNLRYSSHVPNTPSDGGFVKFGSPQAGWEALVWDVRQKCLGNTVSGLTGKSSILDFFKVWAPSSDSNNPQQYAEVVASAFGLSVNARLEELLGGGPPSSTAVSQNMPPNSPQLLDPPDNSKMKAGDSVTFRWQDQGDPDNAPNAWRDYAIRIWDESGNQVLDRGWFRENSVAWTPPGPGRYSWSVAAGDGKENTSSSKRVLLVEKPIPVQDDPNAYHCAFVNQSPYPTVQPGQKISLWVDFRNTGQATWTSLSGGNRGVHLGTNGEGEKFRAPGWLDPQRPAAVKPDGVAPGATGRFEFEIQAPSSPGTYRFWVRPIAENIGWMEDYGVYLNVTVSAPAAQVNPPPQAGAAPGSVVTDPNAYHCAFVNQSAYPTVQPGQKISLWVDFRNTGQATWTGLSGGNRGVHLGTNGEGEKFRAPGWLDPQRPAAVKPDGVAPGATGRFEFEILAPSSPGTYRFWVRPIAENIGWMEDYGVFWNVTVSPPVAQVNPALNLDKNAFIKGDTIVQRVTGCTPGGMLIGLSVNPDGSQSQNGPYGPTDANGAWSSAWNTGTAWAPNQKFGQYVIRYKDVTSGKETNP
ncbi:MAG: hypothetical protein HYU64_13605, partial [Armatimonadetes bacterium]|nr:hypothetical protein [Armatimonadota bacterium]